jgi:glycosyltransferase involved in cell wall biosynthesis
LQQQVLIIGFVWVEPNSSAAGKRMLQLIENLQNYNYKITFASSAKKTENAFDLTSLGIEEVTIVVNSSTFDEFIQRLNPDVVLFDRFLTEEQFGWRVIENCPTAIRILDTEDLHSLRKTRALAVKKQIPFSTDLLVQQDITKREIAAILRCDFSLIISKFEMQLLTETFKIDASLLLFLPFLFDEVNEKKIASWKPYKQRNNFVFIGNFFHKPNVDAVLQLKKHIWKRIRKQIPNAELHIYGAYANQQIKDLNNKKDGFLVKGFTESATDVIADAKVLLAPLQFGAGLKGKLVEAMLYGTPTVTTSIGAEGIGNHKNWNGFITDDFNVFAEKSVKLYSDEQLWKISQQKGVAIVNDNFSKVIFKAIFKNKIEEIKGNLQRHRTQNFIGSLLQYQTLNTTKYMSKWIEEKNKNY